jgi:hypothetical protein
MAVATYTRPRRPVLPLVNLALGVGAISLAVVALAHDDVAEVVVPEPPAAGVPAHAQLAVTEVQTCGVARVDHC